MKNIKTSAADMAGDLRVSVDSIRKKWPDLGPAGVTFDRHAVLNGSTWPPFLEHFRDSPRATEYTRTRAAEILAGYFPDGSRGPESQETPEIKPAPPEIQGNKDRTGPKKSPSQARKTGREPGWKRYSRTGSSVAPKAGKAEQVTGKKDFGAFVLSNPNVRFGFVASMIGAQAYLFALLEQKVMAGVGLPIPFLAAFAVGVLFEAVGFMIARSAPAPDKYASWYESQRLLWLLFFLVIQCLTNICLLEPFIVSGWQMIGRVIVSISVPAGLLAYSTLYLKSE